jgi:hypothetical protein
MSPDHQDFVVSDYPPMLPDYQYLVGSLSTGCGLHCCLCPYLYRPYHQEEEETEMEHYGLQLHVVFGWMAVVVPVLLWMKTAGKPSRGTA